MFCRLIHGGNPLPKMSSLFRCHTRAGWEGTRRQASSCAQHFQHFDNVWTAFSQPLPVGCPLVSCHLCSHNHNIVNECRCTAAHPPVMLSMQPTGHVMHTLPFKNKHNSNDTMSRITTHTVNYQPAACGGHRWSMDPVSR